MDELRCLEFAMSRRKKDPLRPLTDDEVALLTKFSRSQSESATRVARAALILAVARGCDYQRAAESIGRRSGDAVSHLVARFNAEGTAALDPRHGGGRAPVYDQAARERILQEARRRPTPEADGTASWSLTTLQKALRSAPDGLPRVSTYTIGRVLHRAGASPQKGRSWCPTGTVLRKRKGGTVLVTDPDTASKKS
jgi:transposase